VIGVKRSLVSCLACASVVFLCGAGTYVPGVPPLAAPLGERLPLVSLIPFVALLVAIALLPVFAGAWWEANANKGKVAALFALPLAGLMVFHFGLTGLEAIVERLFEYTSLIALLGSLYIVCGGILVEGTPKGSPPVNTSLLALGAVLANLIGTTGASMVLVRPLIRANQHRQHVAHVPIFLIFIVANCGGLLTPLGDPPLFLGYLAGVPFGWTLKLFPVWALVNGALLAIFYVWDWRAFRREKPVSSVAKPEIGVPDRHDSQTPRLRVLGLHNVLLLVGIVVTVFAAGRGLGHAGRRWPFGVQEGLLVAFALASIWYTPATLREKNRFTLGPMIEVAILFAGIFVTMTPALLILNARGGRLGLREPWQFFWASGLLSGILDNAPTYLAVTAVASGAQRVPLQGWYLGHGLGLNPVSGYEQVLAAISCGCVLMGALTYIGNGPNFMIRAIAQESNIRMPSFLGYLAYSASVLLPLFVLATILFFRA
jgi:Na+/H+ antiporter NhaD/arsenite permease-like protein